MCSRRSLSYGPYALIAALFLFGAPNVGFSQVNPCAPKAKKGAANPCAVNPGAPKSPCAPNPCAPKATKAQNPCTPSGQPCAPKSPCAPAGPCAPGARSAAPAKAVLVRGEVLKTDPGAKKLVLKADGREIDLTVGKYSVVREGPQVKSLRDLSPGARVTVSYVDSGRQRTAWFVYLALAQVANPCAANPCAVKNPCAAGNPCAVKNPCAPKQPCAPKATKPQNPCAPNPCAVKGR